MGFRSKHGMNEDVLLDYLTEACNRGNTYKEISEVLKVSKQRVKQMIDKFKLTRPLEARQIARNKAFLEKRNPKWGNDHYWKGKTTDIYEAARTKFLSKRTTARGKGIEFTVEFGDLDFPDYCPMLGIPLNYFADRMCDESVSFDQLDPALGYVKGNVVVCSFRANRIKNDSTPEELYKIFTFLINSARSSIDSQEDDSV